MPLNPSDQFIHQSHDSASPGEALNGNSPRDEALRQIETTQVPKRWLEEGTEELSLPCRKLASSVLVELFSAAGLIPHRISASRVGGIMLVYRHEESGRELEVEIDNKLDVVGVVSTQHDVLESAALEGPDEWRQFAGKFQAAT